MAEMTLEQATLRLTAVGGPFEMETRVIRGVPTRTWKHVPNNLREIFVGIRSFADRTYLVYEDERLTY